MVNFVEKIYKIKYGRRYIENLIEGEREGGKEEKVYWSLWFLILIIVIGNF